ncbi:MBOAT family protein [Candidatus Fermentibacteria bacterium]|nr:MBOAT family protein [Candidatus Fermentibacteria bacterium]
MVFSSHVFLFYLLPLALLGYYALPHRGKHAFLTAISYLFYGWANPAFVLVMATSTLIDYAAALLMVGRLNPRDRRPIEPLQPGTPRTRPQKAALALSVISNLSLLGFFKYFNFAASSYDQLITALGLPQLGLDVAFRVTLPLGISFYTFQSMSYTIDTYRGQATPQHRLTDFACYVSMFPQLVAGPIVRYHEIAGQLARRTYTIASFARGTLFLALGLSKKVLLANPCGTVADAAFSAGSLAAFDAWIGVIAYSFQIYFDFSGYSDMAIGLGLMLGFTFPRNFNRPYLSTSITEFWTRWHMTLSTWFRSYLFLPLAYRLSRLLPEDRPLGLSHDHVVYAGAAVLTMTLAGLWHGAAWSFVLWGLYHGLWLVGERLSGIHRPKRRRSLPRPARIATTFLITLLGWVVFRAESLAAAAAYMGSMTGLGTAQPGAGLLAGVWQQPYYLGTMAIAAVVTWACPDTWEFTRRITGIKAAWSVALLVVSLLVLFTQAYNPFIYFIF